MRDLPQRLFYIPCAVEIIGRERRKNADVLEYLWFSRGGECGLGALPADIVRQMARQSVYTLKDPHGLLR